MNGTPERQLERTYLRAVIVFIAVFAAVLLTGLVYPFYRAEVVRLETELTQEARRKAVYADIFIAQSREQVAAMGSRTQIRQELIRYADGTIGLDALRDYTQSRYLEGLSVYRGIVAAVRYDRDGQIVASKGDAALLPFVPADARSPVMRLRKPEPGSGGRQTPYGLEIRNPIVDKERVLGQDAILFDAGIFNAAVGSIEYRLDGTGSSSVDGASDGEWLFVDTSDPGIRLAYRYPDSALRPDLRDFMRPFLRFAFLLGAVAGIVAYGTLYRASRAILDSLRSLADKRALMVRETNHRVKNNLAIISGLIRLYRVEGDEGDKLRDIQSRIDLISLIHDRLYRSPDAGKVELLSYLRDLVDAIMHAHSKAGTYRVVVEGCELSIGDDVCTGAGFIVSELVLNALKYALAPGDVLGIRLSGTEARWTLECWNSGTPFPDDVDPLTSPSFGMELIRGYAGQLHGTVKFIREPETRFVFEFRNR